MIDVKRFSGVLNKDDQLADVLQPQHIGAKNGRFYGGQNGLSFQNIYGNTLINNSNLPAGTNECIGAFFDSVNQRIIWFNYNSNGNNGIYQYTINTGVVSKLFLCGTDSATDVLTFSLDYPIASSAIVYRPQGDGDLLYWTDGTNRPMYLNLSTVSTLAPFTADMLYAAKMPPPSPPTATYASDATRNYNNVKNRYFRFAQRWGYSSNEKSTFSPTSAMPIPSLSFPEQNLAPNSNNVINVVANSGITSDFKSLEIYGQEFNGVTWGDYFLITSVDVADLSPIPSTYTLAFYNDGIYNTVVPAESDLRFDYLPDKANALELLNGNTIIYAGITEGYDKLERADVDVQITSTLTGLPNLNVTPTWKWANNERFGLIYFDKRGKTNGVVSFLSDAGIDTTNFNVTTPQYPGQPSGVIPPTVPVINASINHLPPSWATTYQWVRVDTAPPTFLQYVCNDYQTDSDFIYLCIQGLVYNNTKTGFLPSYEFKEGDRVRIMATVGFSGGGITTFSTQFDYQILSVEERIMGGLYNTPTTGSYLKCKKPFAFPTPAYSQYMVMEIYTPPTNVKESQALFYEWGQKYDITGGYHMGQTQNQTASQPALFSWTNGYVYYKPRDILTTTGQNLISLKCMDRGYNDFQLSAANSNSRAWIIDTNAKQEYFPVTVRWGGSYIQDTNINNLNRFYPQDLDTIDRSRGDIRRLKTRDRILRVFQERAVGQYGVYSRYLQSNDGDANITTTDSIITANNIQYYKGTYGIGKYCTNLCSTPLGDYFADISTGREVRVAADGITDIGQLYKGQFYFPEWVAPYNKSILRTNGSIAKVMKFWNSYESEAHTVIQSGFGSGAIDYPERHYSFNELRNGFCNDEYSFVPEWALSANNTMFSFKEGRLYRHDSAATYCNFYGTQYGCSITLVFNPNVMQKKGWQSLSELASKVWPVTAAYTNAYSYGTTRQATTIVEQEFEYQEGNYAASIKRDANSQGGKWNGDWMKGEWLAAKFEITNANELVTLQEVICRYIDSAINIR